MNAEKLLLAIGEINDEAIRSAKEQKAPASHRWIRFAALAACLCFVMLSVFAVSRMLAPAPVGDRGDGKDENDAYAEATDRPSDETLRPGAVNYSELLLPETKVDEDVLGLAGVGTADVIAFSESMLADESCCMIVEGSVRDLYLKHYSYEMRSGNEIFQCFTDTVVYEIQVQKTWRGADVGGQTIVVEDVLRHIDSSAVLRKGGRYVIPLYAFGEKIENSERYVDGNIARESPYSTLYPYHPQIEVTLDGQYLVPKDHRTLVKDARPVYMDAWQEKADPLYLFYGAWKDQMYLVSAADFEAWMSRLAVDG